MNIPSQTTADEKRAWLEQWLRDQAAQSERQPVSFGQERLWFLHRLAPDSPVYNLPLGVRLSGDLRTDLLQRALDAMAARHESLRTVLIETGDGPAQMVAGPSAVAVSVVDLTPCADACRAAELERAVRAEARRPFDLERGPLFRVKLFRMSAREHILLAVFHHVISDGQSLDIFLRELAAFYEAFASGRPAGLPELPIQYADFAAWQREHMQREPLAGGLAWWRERLGGDVPVLNLPSDRPRPPAPTYDGAREPLVLPATLVAQLQRLARAEGCTLFMLLLAAFAAWLHRYTGQPEINVGAPVACRHRAELEGLFGFLVNTVVLRASLQDNPGFRQLLRRVRAAALDAYEHQDVPFERLVEELQPRRDLSANPLFQAMLALRGAPPTLDAGGLAFNPFEVDNGTAKLDLALLLQEKDGEISGAVEFNTDLFDAATIRRGVRHFRVMLYGVVANPDRRIGELPLLSGPDRRRILVEWNDTSADYPREKRIHELFEEQVERTPDAVAVTFMNERLTYRALNGRADRLASRLRKLGVGPDVLVGVCLERSPEMIASVLGILKAGGAYMPLDPAHPRERLQLTLNNARVPLVLTQESLRDSFRFEIPDMNWLCVDRLPDTTRDAQLQPAPNSGIRNPKSTDLAYVIHTSGSTGELKGVAIEHRNAVNFICWAQQVFTREELAGVLFSTSLCFDLSVFELFVTLSGGGTVILADNVLQLPALPARDEATLINTVPSAIAELVRVSGIPPSVRTINLAGEPLSPPLVRQLYACSGVRKVYDLYGPTEATTYSTFALREPDGPATIGRPIANTQAYILDRFGEPVPPGVPGELYLGGAGLVRGYLRQPELTGMKFVRHPFSGEPDARLYRTGDRARFRADGNIEFLGRLDHQVKIRGYRVEPGEIEAALARHAEVRESVVVMREDAPGDKRLVAYLTGSPELKAGVASLREFLLRSLPEYMVPAVFVVLPRLPLTPNGKVNRGALPVPEQSRPELNEVYAAPRTAAEETLGKIWREVLQLERIGVNDDFFDLGGNSLLATRMAARMRNAFHIDLPLRRLFEAPTIARLAAAVENALIEQIEQLSEEEAGRAAGRPAASHGHA